MSAVYRQAARRSGRFLHLATAGLLFLFAACGPSANAPDSTAAPDLQSRRFELSDFLASVGNPVDSPATARLVAARGLAWNPRSLVAAAPMLYDPPAGFRIAAVSPRGDRIALVRELDPDSTEVLLHDRTKAETRLLLPVDSDAHFEPQRFSPDGSRLFLFSDEGDNTQQLELFELETGDRTRRSRAGCEALRFDLSADGTRYGIQWSCGGAVAAALFETDSGHELGPLPLPSDTRLARALPGEGASGVVYEIAAARFPRDILFVGRGDAEALALPITFGLAPAIAAEDLVEPAAVQLRPDGPVGAARPPVLVGELWWPRRPSGAPPAVVWLEDDHHLPTWQEFHPLFQFLTNRGVSVLRIRPRGSAGFGKLHRHGADGRLVEAGLEDLDAARAELVGRGADAQRIALVGEGAWLGALAAVALAERPGRYVAAVDLGGDPDPLRQQDLVAALAEPARSWWVARLGDSASESARRDRERMKFSPAVTGRALFLAIDPAAGAWSAEALAARQALDPGRRIELAPAPGGASSGPAGFTELPATAVVALWEFLRLQLSLPR
ncbi:MAG: hypothetical protein ABIV06_11760 [Thermoanaerobaculia bacterium]